MSGLFSNVTVTDHDHFSVGRNAVDNNESKGRTRREQVRIWRQLSYLHHRALSERLELNHALAHVHGMCRKAGSNDDDLGFGCFRVRAKMEREAFATVVEAVWEATAGRTIFVIPLRIPALDSVLCREFDIEVVVRIGVRAGHQD